MAEAQLKDRRSGTEPADIPPPGPALETQGAVVREVGGYHFANNPKTGALSVLNTAELMAFQRLGTADGLHEAEEFFRQLGQPRQEAEANTQRLVARLTRDGWARTALPKSTSRPLSSVYFTLTRECDLACPYCYQGLRKRARKTMPLDHVQAILDKVAAINPDSHIMVTGGEPMLHPLFLEFIEYAKSRGCNVGFITNGTQLTEKTARALIEMKVDAIDISVDALTKETFEEIRQGLDFDVIKQNVINTVKIRNEVGTDTLIYASLVEQKEVLHELDEAVEYWKGSAHLGSSS